MEYFKNKSESFFREIRTVEIYNAADVSYINSYSGNFPDESLIQYKFDIIPETYGRKISTKTQNGNYFFDIDVNFPLLDLSQETIDKCLDAFNQRKFAIVLKSNWEKMVLGNDMERLKVEIIDNKKDDNSGADSFTISINGETKLSPKTKNL